jgi:phosphoglycolate phosphatase
VEKLERETPERTDRRAKTMHGQRLKKLKSIVFDFDGTLAELHLDFPAMKRQILALAQEYFDCPLPAPSAPALEWLETVVSRLQESDAPAASELEKRSAALIKDIELDAAYRGALFPFTRSILQTLGQEGIKIAIITRNCEEAVRIVFPDLDRYCGGFLARDHVRRVKPDPDHLLRALETIAALPENALMVGDHPLDIQTGQRAGILTAGVWSGTATEEELTRSGADLTARNCEELITVLKERSLI